MTSGRRNPARVNCVRSDSARQYVESEASGVRINLKLLKDQLHHLVNANVDSHMSGTLLACVPTAETNHAMAQYECCCFVRGKETCSGTCPCRSAMKVCDVTCNCHGFCCNSLATMPKLGARDSALGREVYTNDDLPQQKLAFAVCGKIITEALFHGMGLIDPLRHFYGVRVSWPGYAKDVPGDPGEVKYVVDYSCHISGMANHSCDPNTVVSACWADGKVYAVGRTLRRILAKEALTFDYRWKGVPDGPAAELCFCRSSRCRGFIADPGSRLMERSIHHYEKKLDGLRKLHEDEENSLLDRIEAMDTESKKVLSARRHFSLIRRLDKNDKLQVACDNIEAAVKRASDAMAVARYAKCVERATKCARQLNCAPCNPKKPSKAATPNPVFSTPGETKPAVSCCGWFGQEPDESIQPLPLSLALACGGAIRYVHPRPPWIPSGSRSRGTLNLKQFPPLSLPCSHLPFPRVPRPRHPRPKPLGKFPSHIAAWPRCGFLNLDERRNLMAWIEGRVSARDNSRGVYPPEGARAFAFWLHTRLRKPGEKTLRSFRRKWSGISTQELVERFEEESGESGGITRRVVHCVLADVLTYSPWKWDLQQSDLKMVEDRVEGDRWPLLWTDLLTLPGIVPEFSADRTTSFPPLRSDPSKTLLN